MDNILETLLQITIFSSVLIAAILVFQKLSEKKIPARLRFIVWLLLLVRLVVPFTFESGVRLIQVRLPETAVAAEIPPQSETRAMPRQNIEGRQTGTARVIWNGALEPVQRPGWQEWLLIAWIGGIAACAIRLLGLRAKTQKIIRCNAVDTPPSIQQLFERCKERMGMKKRIGLCVQVDLDSPALTLSAKPMLLMPMHMLQTMGRTQIGFAISHELAHFKRKDYVISLLMMALRCVYWFNPLVWLAFARMYQDMEMACDEQVTVNMCSKNKKEYVEALLDLSGSDKLQHTLGMGQPRGRAMLEKRIRGIFMKQDKKRNTVIAVIVLIAMLGAVCFTTACQPEFINAVSAAETDMPATEALPQPEPDVTLAAEPTPTATAEEVAVEPTAGLTETSTPDPALKEPKPIPETASEGGYEAEMQMPEEVVTTLTEDEVCEKAVQIVQAVFGVDVSGKELHLDDLAQPTTQLNVMVGGSGNPEEMNWEYYVSLDPKTGNLTWVDKNFGQQVKGLDEIPGWDELGKGEDQQKSMDLAVQTLKNLTGQDSKAYYTDGTQALFDANDSVLTDCHVLLQNGEHYVVSVIYPGYTVGRVYSATYTGDPFVADAQIE